MARYHTDDYIAALNRLPWQPTANLEHWVEKKRLKDSGLSDALMDVLDGLAAMCVRESSESYSTMLALEGNAIHLSVASSSGEVPDSVVHHLQSIWQHMLAMHDHEDAPAVRRGEGSRVGFNQLCRNFDLEQCRFAMPALRARLTYEAASVVESLGVMLTCHGPHTAEVSVLLQSCGRVPVWQPLSVAETQFLELCLASLEDLRRIAVADHLTDETVALVLRKMQALHIEVKRMLSKDITLFKMTEAICGTPVRFHLQRILWLSDPCGNTPALALSSEFAPWARKPLLVSRIPPMSCSTPLLDVAGLAHMASLVYTKNRELQSDDIRAFLVEPIGLLVQEREALASLACTPGHHQLHSAMVLLHHLDALRQRAVQYIGHSELCCLPCYLFLSAYNLCGASKVHIRGTHGRTPLSWVAPELRSANINNVLNEFSIVLTDAFFWAWGSRAKAQEVKRSLRSLGDDDGDGDDDDDDADYDESGSDLSDYTSTFNPEAELPLLPS